MKKKIDQSPAPTAAPPAPDPLAAGAQFLAQLAQAPKNEDQKIIDEYRAAVEPLAVRAQELAAELRKLSAEHGPRLRTLFATDWDSLRHIRQLRSWAPGAPDHVGNLMNALQQALHIDGFIATCDEITQQIRTIGDPFATVTLITIRERNPWPNRWRKKVEAMEGAANEFRAKLTEIAEILAHLRSRVEQAGADVMPMIDVDNRDPNAQPTPWDFKSEGAYERASADWLQKTARSGFDPIQYDHDGAA